MQEVLLDFENYMKNARIGGIGSKLRDKSEMELGGEDIRSFLVQQVSNFIDGTCKRQYLTL